MQPSIWRRHRALRVIIEAWPELESDEPPSRALLAKLLDGTAWQLATQREAARGYEALVVEGKIPTRDGSWHDAFNLLAFLSFPTSKRALHERVWRLQQARRGPSGRGGVRSREEDALSLLDEATVVIAGTPAAIAAFERARGQESPLRADRVVELDRVVRGEGIGVRVLGHALLEHLVLDRRPIGAGVLTVEVEGPLAWERVDRSLAERIAAGGFPAPQPSPKLPWPDPMVDAWLV